MIGRWVVYKVKKVVYSMLYGYMKDYYCKVGRYFEELKSLNNLSVFDLVTDFDILINFLIFQFFVCYEGF